MVFGLNFEKKNEFFSECFQNYFFLKIQTKNKTLNHNLFLNYLKSMPTNLGCIYRKLKKLLASQIGRSITFLRKLRLSCSTPCHLGVNSKTDVVITSDIVGILKFCKNWEKLQTLG